MVNPAMDPAPNPQYAFLNRTSNPWSPVKGTPAPYIAWRRDDVAVQNSINITFQLKASNFGKQRELQIRGKRKRRDIRKGHH